MAYAQTAQGNFNPNTGLGLQSDYDALLDRVITLEADEPSLVKRDGSRAMIGDLNLASNDITAVDNIAMASITLGGTAITSSATELNILDGVTATASELNYLDITTLGYAYPNKALVAGASGEIIAFTGNQMELTNFKTIGAVNAGFSSFICGASYGMTKFYDYNVDINSLNLLNVAKIVNTGDLFIQLGATKTLYFGIDGINYIFMANNTEIQFNKTLDMNNQAIIACLSVAGTTGSFTNLNAGTLSANMEVSGRTLTTATSRLTIGSVWGTEFFGEYFSVNISTNANSSIILAHGNLNGYTSIKAYTGSEIARFNTTSSAIGYIDFYGHLRMNTKNISGIGYLTATELGGALSLGSYTLSNCAILNFANGSVIKEALTAGDYNIEINAQDDVILKCATAQKISMYSSTTLLAQLSSSTISLSIPVNFNAQTISNMARINIDNTLAYLSFWTGGGVKSENWRIGANTLTSIGSAGYLDAIGTIRGYSTEMVFRNSSDQIKLKLNGNGIDCNGVNVYSAGAISFANNNTYNQIYESASPYHLNMESVADLKLVFNKGNTNPTSKLRILNNTQEYAVFDSNGDLYTDAIRSRTGGLNMYYTTSNYFLIQNSASATKLSIGDSLTINYNNLEMNDKNITKLAKISSTTTLTIDADTYYKTTGGVEKLRIVMNNTNDSTVYLSHLGGAYYNAVGVGNIGSTKNGIATASDTTGTTYHSLFYNPNGLVGSITTNGSATSFNTTSDYRLKKDVKKMDYDESAKRLNEVKPCKYKFIKDNDDKIHFGFIAHELQEIFPNAVVGEKDGCHCDNKGNKVEDYQSVDYSKLVPDLVAVVQGLMKENNDLKDVIKTYDERIKALENLLYDFDFTYKNKK